MFLVFSNNWLRQLKYNMNKLTSIDRWFSAVENVFLRIINVENLELLQAFSEYERESELFYRFEFLFPKNQPEGIWLN